MGKEKRAGSRIELQERDLAVMRGLFESRVMTSAHVAAIYFGSRREAAKKRLRRLKDAGMIAESRRHVCDPALLFLSRDGRSLLRMHGILSEYPPLDRLAMERRGRVSDLTLGHELSVMDVKAAFHAAAAKSGRFSISEFCTWPQLNQFEASPREYGSARLLIKPDGFARIRDGLSGNPEEGAFFVELDRSTVTLEALVSRAYCYFNYYKSGGFAEREGGVRAAPTKHPFRVLFVFKTAERRNNFAERLAFGATPILTQAWLSTLAEVTEAPFGPVWVRPLDYREAVRGTRFDPGLGEGPPRRWAEREAFVVERMEGRTLFDDAA